MPNLAVPKDIILFAFYMMSLETVAKIFFVWRQFCLVMYSSAGKFLECYGSWFSVVFKYVLSYVSSFHTADIGTSGRERIISFAPSTILNNRDRVVAERIVFCGLEYYGRKYHENELTAFIQLVWILK